MTHLVAGALAAATVTLLLGVYLSRPAPSAAIVHQAPIELQPPSIKGDRLRRQAAPIAEPPPVTEVAEPAHHDGLQSATVGATRESKEAASMGPSPETVVRAVGAASTKLDPVCGAKGRTWYTRESGWRYWRCVR